MTRSKRLNPILAYTTEIAAAKTIGELTEMLAKKGALHVGVEYAAGQPISVTFTILIGDAPTSFRLTPHVEGVSRSVPGANKQRATNIAWRILLRWVEAQLAMNQAQQAEMAQLFLPYAVAPDGQTFWEKFERKQFAQLSDGR